MNRTGKTVLKALFVASVLIVALQLLITFVTLAPMTVADIVNITATIGNMPPTINGTQLEGGADSISLVESGKYTAYCTGTVNDTNGYGDVTSLTGELFHTDSDHLWETSDNNSIHYSNNSCTMTGGSGQYADGRCDFEVIYYASNGTWTCNLTATDIAIQKGSSDVEDDIEVQDLIALDVPGLVDFGSLYVGDTSGETTITTTNTGNTMIDILLDAYGFVNGDAKAMVCTGGGVGSIDNSWLKYNATETAMDFDDGTMTAITDDPVLRDEVNLYQSNEVGGNSTQATYWKLRIPVGVEGFCSGIVTFGVQSAY